MGGTMVRGGGGSDRGTASGAIALDGALLGQAGPGRREGRRRPGVPLRGAVGVLVALVLVAVVVPLVDVVAVPTSASALGIDQLTALPASFTPVKINDHDQVAGIDYSASPSLIAVWQDGALTRFPGSANRTVIDLDEDGRVLASFSGQLEVWTESGATILEKPVVDGSARGSYQGWGPDVDNRVVGVFGWNQAVKANAAQWLGSAPPSVITAISTVMAVAPNGLTFGQLPGSTTAYGLMSGSGSVQTVGGFPAYVYGQDLSSTGYLLGLGPNGNILWHAGTSTSLSILGPKAVNDKGAVLGYLPADPNDEHPSSRLALRTPLGQDVVIKDVIGGTDAWWSLFGPVAMNDDCDVVGQGQLVTGAFRYFVTAVPNCAGDAFQAEVSIADGAPVVNREMTLELTLSSDGDRPVDDLALAGGVGISAPADQLEIVSGPTPAPPTSLPATGSASVTFVVKPLKTGTVTVQASATGTRDGTPISAESTFDLEVEAAGLGGTFFRTDNKGDFVKVGEPAPVRLRVSNETGEDLTDVKLLATHVVADGDAGEASLSGPTGSLRGTLAATGLDSLDFLDFELSGTTRGHVKLQAEVSAKDEAGEPVTATLERSFEVRQDRLKVNIALDPPEYTFPDDLPPGQDPPPVEITETITLENTGDVTIRDVKLESVDVVRKFSGQELYVTFKDGVNPDPIDPAVVVAELAPHTTSEPLIAHWVATDDNEVTFKASASGVDDNSEAVRGVAEKDWKADPTKYIGFTAAVVNPPAGELLDAGSPIIVRGKVENLSNSAKLTLGPLYPELTGNTGTMNIAYGDTADVHAPNPHAPVSPPPLQLDPSEEKYFEVQITTSYSDPRSYDAESSGGTRANLAFAPWGFATELDGTEHLIKTYDANQPGQEPDGQVRSTPADLNQVVSIDDSIELPPSNKPAVVAGYLAGTVEGLKNAAIAAIYSIPDLIKAPYTILRAAIDYQSKVWDSFTPQEREDFASEASYLIVSVLQRNVEFGIRDGKELWNEVDDYVGKLLTDTENEWQTGDYLSTARTYSAFLSETIGSVAGPIVLSKLASSSVAVNALERAQTALQARMAPYLAAAADVRIPESVLPILQALENGTELNFAEIEQLYGITQEEIRAYQQIADELDLLITVRSRHASSVQWIKKFGALLKPEAIKIKTVSELDVKLGYRLDDLGSVVFRKPEALKAFQAEGGNLGDHIISFIESKGFQRGTPEYQEAALRVQARIKEWDKYESAYKLYAERGWIETSFNYTGNEIPSTLTEGQRGKFTGFKLVETSPGSEEYVVKLLDGKTGKFRPITGDIDPIAFTYTDGSPLTPDDHAKLIDRLKNSIIGAEHGESATFSKGGADFVLGQFKPNEGGLQIGPHQVPPRVVRLDTAKSRWVNPRDYDLHWEGGYVDAGTGRSHVVPGEVDPNFNRTPLPAPEGAPQALPSAAPEPTVGRCIVTFANSGGPDTVATYVAADGFLTNVDETGQTARSPLHSSCFSEGATESVTVAPTSTLVEPTDPARAARALLSPSDARAAGSTRAVPAGSTQVEVSGESVLAGTGSDGFVAGQSIQVGAGTDHAEIRTVSAASGTVLTLAEPLDSSHDAGEVVVMVRASDGTPVAPVPPATETTPVPAASAPGSGGTTTGSLPRTGSDLLTWALLGLGLIAVGEIGRGAGRRRSAIERGSGT